MNKHKFGIYDIHIEDKDTDEFTAKLANVRTTTQLVACIYPRVKEMAKPFVDALPTQRSSDSFKMQKQELTQHLCITCFNSGAPIFIDALHRSPMAIDTVRDQVKAKIIEAIDVCVALAGIDYSSDSVSIQSIITHYRETF